MPAKLKNLYPGKLPLPQLNLTSYDPQTIHYHQIQEDRDLPNLDAWVELFRKTTPTYQKLAAADPSAKDRKSAEQAAQRFADHYNDLMLQLAKDPLANLPGFGSEPLSIFRIVALREACLKGQGFWDPFKPVKDEENKKALKLLPGILKDLDDVQDRCKRLELALRGVFAGNVFDLGAQGTADMFENGEGGFEKTRVNLVERPWAIDNLDDILQRWKEKPHHKAMLFVDNAGTDVVLGMIPLARELIKNGTFVVLAANEVPALNDITAPELKVLLRDCGKLDKLLGRAVEEEIITVVSSGSALPIIDLTKLSPECVAAAEGVDLVVMEGMGRAIETNLYASFSCDSLKLAMVKHPEVAQVLKCRMYDCVCKFDRGKGQPGTQWGDILGDASWINKHRRQKQQMCNGKASPWTSVVGSANWIPRNGGISLCVGDDD
ncbi:hypothetical protein ABBQ32_006916 [Trebouxia sp. C0010 RCD-2024]